MGSIIGDRLSNHAQCYLDRFHLGVFAILSSNLLATVPAPSGNHGMKAICVASP